MFDRAAAALIDALRAIAGELRQPAIRPLVLADRLDRLADAAETDRDAVAREAEKRRTLARALLEQAREEERHDFRPL